MPEIIAEAWVTQYPQVVVDPTDQFGCGYRVGDIWPGGKVSPNNHTNMANFEFMVVTFRSCVEVLN